MGITLKAVSSARELKMPSVRYADENRADSFILFLGKGVPGFSNTNV